MRIVHVILTRRFAGSERYALELANAQSEHHEVHMVLRRCGAEARVDALAHRLAPAVQLHTLRNWWPGPPLRRLLARLAPEIVHGHLSGACRALRGAPAGSLQVATLHIAYKPRQHAHLDGLVAIAPWQLPAIPEPLRARSIQIDNWTQATGADPEARRRLRNSLGLSPDTYLFGALGRIEPSKGLDLLLAAWQQARPGNARLAIVGQGSGLRALRRQADAEVILPGFAERPQDWLAAFDCFVSAARSEPFGLVLLEAMAAGLPVIASASEGASHLAPHLGINPLPVADVDALAAALTEAAQRRPARRNYALERFRIPGRLAELETWYRAGLARLRGAQQS